MHLNLSTSKDTASDVSEEACLPHYKTNRVKIPERCILTEIFYLIYSEANVEKVDWDKTPSFSHRQEYTQGQNTFVRDDWSEVTKKITFPMIYCFFIPILTEVFTGFILSSNRQIQDGTRSSPTTFHHRLSHPIPVLDWVV